MACYRPTDTITCTLYSFTFRGRTGHRYVVYAERYDNDVFALKFFLADEKNSPHRFKTMSGLNDSIRVLSTVLSVMVELIRLYPGGSFVIKGMESDNETGVSKRFKVYRRIIINYFSAVRFEHLEQPKLNLYFLLNKSVHTPNLARQIIEMLETGYGIDLVALDNSAEE